MPFRKQDLPFDGLTQRFIVVYVQYKDLDKSAKVIGITPGLAKALWRKRGVKEECERRLEIFHTEMAKLDAKATYLCEAKLDKELVDVIESAPNNSSVKVRALEVGYKKLGLLKEKMEHSGENGGPLVFTVRRIEGDPE